MKARTDCTVCRKRIYDEAKEAYLKREYAYFRDSAYSMAVYATVCAIAVMTRRGRSKDYIRKFFDEMCLIYDYPAQFGKELTMNELMKQFEKEYGIDFRRINVHIETEEQFIREVKKCSDY